jgi:hypothetical protein
MDSLLLVCLYTWTIIVFSPFSQPDQRNWSDRFKVPFKGCVLQERGIILLIFCFILLFSRLQNKALKILYSLYCWILLKFSFWEIRTFLSCFATCHFKENGLQNSHEFSGTIWLLNIYVYNSLHIKVFLAYMFMLLDKLENHHPDQNVFVLAKAAGRLICYWWAK